MRICRFSTGEEPRFGVVTGEVDEFGQPADDSVVVALAGRPALRRDQAARGGAPAQRRTPARADHPAQQGRRDRSQLRRPRRRDGQRPADRAADVPQAQHHGGGPGRPDLLPVADQQPPLRGRAGRGDRSDLPRRARRAGDRRDLRLHHRQRRDRARPAALRRAVHPRQGVRLLLPGRPVDRDRPRPAGLHRRPPGADVPQRRRRPGRLDRRHDLRRPDPRRPRVVA